jgi:3-hydroxybutyrate dehydrogenase
MRAGPTRDDTHELAEHGANNGGAQGLDGKAAVVTGAASGIGRAVASRFCDAGMNVLAVDLSPDPDGPGAPYKADLTAADANSAAVDTAIQRFGRLDVVVASAGIQHVAPIDEFPQERWETLISLMLTSPFLLAKHAWAALQASGAGRFVVIASVHGLVASPYKAGYVSAKHGALGLVKTLALEGADHGIAAVAVCPAYVRTPLVEKQVGDQARVHSLSEERVLEEVILAPQAVKHLIEPAEVADVVAFLSGPAGMMFTGVPVTMDYGWTAR